MASMEPGISSSRVGDHLRSELLRLSHDIHQLIQTLETSECSVLHELEHIHQSFHDIQTATASYYLRSYLAAFTNHFEVLSVAIQHLSERNHGALIAIQREDKLEEHLHAGIPLHAELSHPLLESIFYTGNPLHDGGVLIHQDTIVSAANVLPLSENMTIRGKVGTRHRAALGLSEQTDALVLTVSEETGRATFAFGGNLYPIRTSSGLV
ncbi:sporulation-specific diadenylate cyclase CdaS [Virgibacillus xinjiangensis]|uniref:Diadenylate cyclase n=1 Tax=Virgibacillus xinjiangensis TaxID=393090 RepID=A0ABV7CXI1_9BACI